MTSSPSVRFLYPGLPDWAPTVSDPDQPALPDQDQDDRLPAFLLTSLQMQHLLVLAGSGTSLEVGGPTMGQLWTECVPPKGKADTAPILKKLRYGQADEEHNIEELLSRCDAHLQVNPDASDIAAFREKAISTILERCRAVGVPSCLWES
jgi:hypothetical protein